MDNQELTPEALVDLPVPRDIRISPDGTKVVYVVSSIAKAGEHEVSSLWIADVGKEHSARQLTSGLSHDEIPQWDPTQNGDDTSASDRIAFVSDRAKAGESSAIYVISISGGEAYPITKADNKKKIAAFKWDWSGHCIAFISPDEKSSEQESIDKDNGDVKVYGEHWEFNRLRCVHVATREVQTLFKRDAHVTDFAWNEAGNEIIYIWQRTPDMNSPGYYGVEFERSDVSTKSSSPIAKFPGPVKDLTWHDPTKTLYFRAGATPDKIGTSSSIYQLSLTDRIWKRVFPYAKLNCAMELRQNRGYLAIHVQDGLFDRLFASTDSRSPRFPEWYEIEGQILAWDVLFPRSGSDLLKVFAHGNSSSPTEVWSQHGDYPCTQPGDPLCQLSQHGSVIAKSQIGVAEPLRCNAKDGEVYDGILIKPSKYRSHSGSLPTFVFIHGGPYSRVSVAFDTSYFYWAPYLLSAGYAVLCPNYRGGSSHGEDYAKKARGGMGREDYDDVISLVKHAINLGVVDKERVVVGGYSQGGFLSYLAVTRPDFRFKAAICGAGVTDWDMMSMTSDAPWFEAECAGKAPWQTDASDTNARHGSAIWNMKNVKTPILILHPENDERVPLTQARAFHRGCLHYGVPCEFVTYPREGHLMKERKHIIDMMKRVRRFCDLHLG